jgi:hypothetical protein
MSFDLREPQPGDGLSELELALYGLIMEYRAENGLPSIPLSTALTATAGRHAADTMFNIWGAGLDLPLGANLHSWSDAPYYGDHRAPEVMWDAPARIGVDYASAGYEISAAGYASIEDALEGWKGSPSHDAVILNEGLWADVEFRAIGVGIERDRDVQSDYGGPAYGMPSTVYHVWFGEAADLAGAPVVAAPLASTAADSSDDPVVAPDVDLADELLVSFADHPGPVEANLQTGEGDWSEEIVGVLDRVVDLVGSAFDDVLVGNDVGNTLRGGAGDDELTGLAGIDDIFGGSGDDTIFGGSGSDRLNGGGGADVIDGMRGKDTILAGSGSDSLWGSQSADRILGMSGDDWIASGSGPDDVDAGSGADYVEGGSAADVLRGSSGDDEIYSGSGNDLATGGSGHDWIAGSSGDDRILGGSGFDELWGDSGDDRIEAGSGSDLLVGGTGDDHLTGGADADDFYFFAGDGDDVITDFEHGEDLIWFARFSAETDSFDEAIDEVEDAFFRSGDDVVFALGDDRIVIRDSDYDEVMRSYEVVFF